MPLSTQFSQDKSITVVYIILMYIKGRQEGRMVGDGWSDERYDRSTYRPICLLREATLHVDIQVALKSKRSMTKGVMRLEARRHLYEEGFM